MRWVRSWFEVLPLNRAVELLYAGRIPSRALAITFDDGYADNEELAAPILQSLGMTATFFVSTGFLDGACMWNDKVIESVRACRAEQIDLGDLGLGAHSLASVSLRRQAISKLLEQIKHLEPDRRVAVTQAVMERAGLAEAPSLMMRPEKVRRLRALGMDVGAHTVTHPILTRLNRPAAQDEMAQSKRHLEAILGESISLFAYPNGVPDQDYAAEHLDMVRQCGFSAAVSTAWGAASMRSDRYQLPRFTPWDRTRLRYGARLLGNLGGTEQRVATRTEASPSAGVGSAPG